MARRVRVTGGDGGKGIRGRIELKRGKRLPATLPLLSKPSRPQLQIGEAAIPMVIDEGDGCPLGRLLCQCW